MARTRELSPAGSLERDEGKLEKKAKTRRPPNTAFRQQRLKAWQPILTPKTVLPIFYSVGLLFALFGGLMLWASSEVQELAIDYTSCGTEAPIGSENAVPLNASRVISHFSSSNDSSANMKAVDGARWYRNQINVTYGDPSAGYSVPTNSCTIQFYVPNNIQPPVFLYYRLTNFYQNHRRYVKSLDQDQLKGTYRDNASISNSDCDPLKLNASGYAYYPCGLIANSIFNDTIMEPVLVNSGNYSMTDQGIGWSSDAKLYNPGNYTTSEVAPPPNWVKRYPNGYNDQFPIPDFSTNEHFWVWMRTAGLPTFSKLYRKNTADVMSQGTYTIEIYDDFPSELYGGTKELLFSTRTTLGGKNPFLGIAYVVVAGICIVLGAIFTAMHLIKPRKLGDHTYLSWNNEATSATATGRSLGHNEGA